MTLTQRLAEAMTRLFSRSGDYRRRYGSAYGSNSVDYRKNRRALNRGEMPAKFEKLASLVPGDKVVDIGAGEGLLALAMAPAKTRVRAIDITPRRHHTGLELRDRWQAMGRKVDTCEMVLGDALTDPALIEGFDTLVASRVVYYFGDRIDPFMAEVAKRVQYVCLVGNASRNKRFERGTIPGDVGQNVIYSTAQGMKDLLERHGFDIVDSGVTDKDPYVIGRRRAA